LDGYLIWPPLLRTRFSSTAADYLEFYFDQPGAGAVLDSYPHDLVLIGLDVPACHLMEHRRDWKLLYRNSPARTRRADR
jgi:hypothetical protein